MGTGELLQDGCTSGTFSVLWISTDFSRITAELASRKLQDIYGASTPLETSSVRSWITQLTSSVPQWVEMGRIAIWTDAPSTQISLHTKEKFHAWCAAISTLVFSFVLYSQRRKWLRLYLAKWGKACAAGSTEWHTKRPDMTTQLCLLPGLACIDFCGHPEGKMKGN